MLELLVLARPVVDLPLHAGLDLLASLLDPLQSLPLDLLQVLGHQALHRVGQHQLVPVLVQPAIPQQRLDQLQLTRAKRAVVEIGGGAGALHGAGTGDLKEHQPVGDELLLPLAVPAPVLQAMLQTEHQPRLGPQIVVVDQHGPLAEHLAVAFPDQGDARLQQGMARAHQLGPGALPHMLLLKADALVAGLHRHPHADLLVAIEQLR